MGKMSATADVDRSAGLGVLLAACVSALVVNANTSAVTILLPAISEDLDAPISQLQWAVTGYMLVGAAVIVTAGSLGDVLGRRRVFLGGLVLFVASGALIALSGSGEDVIVGRMIQGAGSTLLACGMSLLSVDSSGAAQIRAIT
jgi:MFS family permease